MRRTRHQCVSTCGAEGFGSPLRLEAANKGDHSVSPRPCRWWRCCKGNHSVLLEKKINRRIDVSSFAAFQVSLERATSVLGQKGTQKRGIGHTFSPLPFRLASALQCVRVF